MPDKNLDLTPEERDALRSVAEKIAEHAAVLADEETEGAMLVRYVCIVDWAETDGGRSINWFGGNLNGDEPTRWEAEGMLFDVLFDSGVES